MSDLICRLERLERKSQLCLFKTLSPVTQAVTLLFLSAIPTL